MQDMVLLWDLGIIIVAATLTAYVAKLLKQPLILAYILAGILIGPMGLKLIAEQETIKILSELGIAFLLFIVGLELDLRRLKDIGVVSSVTGILKSILLFCISFLVAGHIGLVNLEPVYFGLILAFSSTMVVIKLLSDKNELDTLHGKITLGILLTEDVLAILALSVLSAQGNVTPTLLLLSILKGLGLFSIAILVSHFVLPTVLKIVAKSQELLFLTSLSLCFVFAYFSYISGFSVAIGSFIAGIAVAAFPYNIEIIGRVRSLRDFFSTIFFVSLGMEISPTEVTPLIFPLIVVLAILIILKPLIILALVSMMGYGRRPSFLTAISLTQISEFSLIIALQGMLDGQVSQYLFSLTTLTAVVTITATSYLIQLDNELYRRLSSYLIIFDKLSGVKRLVLEDLPQKSKQHSIIFGCHRMGYSIAKTLKKVGDEFIVVDFNPEIIKMLLDEGISCIYGDIGDIEILDRVGLQNARLVISTIPEEEENSLLIQKTKEINPKAMVFVTADTVDQALQLYDLGADYVILPRNLSGEKISELIEEYAKKPRKIEEITAEHIKNLERMKAEEILNKYEPSFLKSLEQKFNGHHKR